MSNVPALRFPGFSGEWEEKKLREVFSYEQPTKYIVNNTDYSDTNKIPVLTAGKSFVLGYTSEPEGIFKSVPVVIFDDFTTASKFVDFNFKVKSSAMKILKCNNIFDIKFSYEALNYLNFKPETHKRHWISEFSGLNVPFPLLPEQQKIANFLTTLDNKIENLKKQEKLFQTLKKGFLQKLFPQTGKLVPELRFPGFDGEWEERKLGEVLEENPKSKIPVNLVSDNKLKDSINKFPYYTSGQKIYYTDKSIVDGKNIFIATGGKASVFIYNGESSYSTDTYSIFADHNNNTVFLYFQILRGIPYIERILFKGNGLKHLEKKGFKDLTSPFPQLREQQKIADFLSKIDQKIDSTQRSLVLTNRLKKGFLQKVLV